MAQLFDSRAWKGEVRVRYARPTGDLTSPLPSSHHLYYVSKGWVAASLDEPALATNAEIAVPDDIAEHGRHDRVGIWTRGADSLESSCRNAPALLAKGWAFSGPADEERRRAVAEARPLATAREVASHAAPSQRGKGK